MLILKLKNLNQRCFLRKIDYSNQIIGLKNLLSDSSFEPFLLREDREKITNWIDEITNFSSRDFFSSITGLSEGLSMKKQSGYGNDDETLIDDDTLNKLEEFYLAIDKFKIEKKTKEIQKILGRLKNNKESKKLIIATGNIITNYTVKEKFKYLWGYDKFLNKFSFKNRLKIKDLELFDLEEETKLFKNKAFLVLFDTGYLGGSYYDVKNDIFTAKLYQTKQLAESTAKRVMSKNTKIISFVIVEVEICAKEVFCSENSFNTQQQNVTELQTLIYKQKLSDCLKEKSDKKKIVI